MDLQIYPCAVHGVCHTYPCNKPTEWIIARKDVVLGTALATGERYCTECARNLAANIPLKLLVDQPLDIESRMRAEIEKETDEKVKTAYEAELLALNNSLNAKDQEIQALKEQLDAKPPEPVKLDIPDDEEGDETVHRCLDCNQEFATKKELNKHKLEHRREAAKAELGK